MMKSGSRNGLLDKHYRISPEEGGADRPDENDVMNDVALTMPKLTLDRHESCPAPPPFSSLGRSVTSPPESTTGGSKGSSSGSGTLLKAPQLSRRNSMPVSSGIQEKYRPVVQSAAKAIAKIDKRSRIPKRLSAGGNTPRKVAPSELMVGKLLGSGSFSEVYEVRVLPPVPRLDGKAAATSSHENDGDVPGLARHLSDGSSSSCSTAGSLLHGALSSSPSTASLDPNQVYAVKRLAVSTIRHESNFRIGAIDLACEGRYLSVLSHRNIIQLKGISQQGTQGFGTGRVDGFFLLLEKVDMTLESQLEAWRLQQQEQQSQQQKAKLHRRPSAMRKLMGKSRRRLQEQEQLREEWAHTELSQLLYRLSVAADIAAALTYLHANHVLYRDLKPENVGFVTDHFEQTSVVKIFDFGLAKELHKSRHVADGLYHMSAKTGSMRYMAPEVASSHPYGKTADVYSLAILLWEMGTLQTPFEGMTREQHYAIVVCGHGRPKLQEGPAASWSPTLQDLLRQAWTPAPQERPAIQQVEWALQEEVAKMRAQMRARVAVAE